MRWQRQELQAGVLGTAALRLHVLHLCSQSAGVRVSVTPCNTPLRPRQRFHVPPCSGGMDGRVKIWEVATGRCLQVRPGWVGGGPLAWFMQAAGVQEEPGGGGGACRAERACWPGEESSRHAALPHPPRMCRRWRAPATQLSGCGGTPRATWCWPAPPTSPLGCGWRRRGRACRWVGCVRGLMTTGVSTRACTGKGLRARRGCGGAGSRGGTQASLMPCRAAITARSCLCTTTGVLWSQRPRVLRRIHPRR